MATKDETKHPSKALSRRPESISCTPDFTSDLHMRVRYPFRPDSCRGATTDDLDPRRGIEDGASPRQHLLLANAGRVCKSDWSAMSSGFINQPVFFTIRDPPCHALECRDIQIRGRTPYSGAHQDISCWPNSTWKARAVYPCEFRLSANA